MTVTINGTSGIAGVDGSAGTPAIQGADTNTGVFFPAADTAAISTGGSERMRVDSSGNVGIGASPSYRLDVNATSFIAASVSTSYSGAGNIRIADASTTSASAPYIGSVGNNLTFGRLGTAEYARIDSSGLVTIGSTAQTKGNLNIWNAANTQTNIYLYKNTQVEGYFGFVSGASSNLYINTGSTFGTTGVYMANGGTSWTSNSDERLKENLVPIANAISKVSTLRSVIGNFIADENKTPRPFLIAQDVQQVLPEAIGTSEIDGTEYLGVSYTDVIPLLVAAIKEQQALITALTARIEALEAK